ncbi:uncharacterized protein LOC143806051 [Ranitomeya variabilis]|uniref:uncharacterized protein LOC143806051 n=1 Tax=Ranitomeya variabilis TaxID=490064 RepID=UPI0040572418
MEYAKKTVVFLTLCALVGAKQVENNLEILVSVPSTHIGDTEIVSSPTSLSGPSIKCTIVLGKNQTLCMNSADPSCNAIQEPIADLSLSFTPVGNNVPAFTFSSLSISESHQFNITVDANVTVNPQNITSGSGGSGQITVILNINYNTATTTTGSFSSGKVSPTLFRYNGIYRTTVTDTKPDGNGQSALRCGPLSALIVLALLPVLLLK